MNKIVASYRIQFHKVFSFSEFEKIVPYLQKLGVSTIYASPVFTSSEGSTHGYDAMNPHEVDPEIGTGEQLKRISGELRERGMSWLQDIVPNHMAFHPQNPWLMDVLEKGQQSPFARFFDILWDEDGKQGKVMAPFLGDSLEDTVAKGELQLAYQQERLVLSYFDTFYPLNPRSYNEILKSVTPKNDALDELLVQLSNMHRVEDPRIYYERWSEFLLQLASLMRTEGTGQQMLAALSEINSNSSDLLRLAQDQEYRLCLWSETDSKINFRRFFTVNGLICLNIQDPEVFEYYHRYIRELTEQGIVQGLRVDHVDGLYDPEKYLKDLRKLAGEDTYIVVEKILETGEAFPNWPVQGNTGYDFLALVNNLFTNKSSKKHFTRFYQKLTGDKTSVHDQILRKKADILFQNMQGELDNLCMLFVELNLGDRQDLAKVEIADLRGAIAGLLIHCPVYRYYGNTMPLSEMEAGQLSALFKSVGKEDKKLLPALNLLEKAILRKTKDADSDYRSRALKFYQRLMQFTGPLMAKGVEDTLMYTYNRFIGHNEVGDAPESFGISKDDFHQEMKVRQKRWPMSMNATSTHDTKRGEDVRTRLNVLTDLPEEWFEAVKLWQYLSSGLKSEKMPDENDEYFLFQTMAGAYPMPGQPADDFDNRLLTYLEKSLREAKRHSGWASPNEEYERAVRDFAIRLLEPDKAFWKQFQNFQKKIVDYGIVNSLAQVLLKFTCPGIPDVYQGCELWDLSLVDPDNRRPVDYDKRRQMLSDLEFSQSAGDELMQELWQSRYDGKIKLWLTQKLFKARSSEAEVFEKGEYIPLVVKGPYKDHILAFARRYKRTWYLSVVPLHLAQLARKQEKDIDGLKWKATRVILPENAPGVWENLLVGTKGKAGKEIFIKDIFTSIPLGFLKLQHPRNDRGAGILLHITSLPSPFGTGDFGPQAKVFVDYLSKAGQKLWQILPLSATEQGQCYSPYSAISSMAGNTLLISPEVLVEDGLLSQDDLKGYHLAPQSAAAFAEAERIRDELFEVAYTTFLNKNFERLRRDFNAFCERESYWLEDYALYITIKQKHHGRPWYEWGPLFKRRERTALADVLQKESYFFEKTKWLQFIFMKQWQELKAYSNDLGIRIFGDLPFYVSYDSADVWSKPEMFCLDQDGNPTEIAGVPPDYFNENGQLWGMPVFRWDVLKARDYDWWVKRIRKNMELYDVLRLDHFRAFSSYWSVPANELTAKNGEWLTGPGDSLFRTFEEKLGELSFIAEDLGDIDQPVYDLRDQFGFPGMKVLQFAFGQDLPLSIDIPHNYTSNFFVYTGTHDNNTTLGWYRKELDSAGRGRMRDYTGQKVNEKNVHKVLARMAYASVAKTVILPFQDIIGLDESSRMNTPASTEDNWSWRLRPQQLKSKYRRRLRKWVELYNRY